MFVEHSSPRAERILNADVAMRENTRHFNPKTLSPNFKAKPQQQSPKRKYSDDFDHKKRTKNDELKLKHDNDITHCHADDWPVFLHPDGGFIQQSPYGFIHIIKDENSERSSIDNTICLETFSKKIPQPEPPKTTPKTTKQKVPLPYSRLPLPYSPSGEIENYMVEGYADQQELNKSYDHHTENIVNVNYNLYDHHNEDEHLETEKNENENDDYDMIL